MKAVYLFILLITTTANGLMAQIITANKPETERFLVDANGRILQPNNDLDEEGSPYYAKAFLEGSITILKGKTYHGIRLKINFYSNEVVFLDTEGNEMVVAQPVERVELQTTTGRKVFLTGLPTIDGHDPAAFYERLDSGSANLLKYTEVKFSERQPYPNARFVRTYRDRVLYYVCIDGKNMNRIPTDHEEIITLFAAPHRELIKAWMKKESIKIKKEEDLVRLFQFYNSLLKKVD